MSNRKLTNDDLERLAEETATERRSASDLDCTVADRVVSDD